MGDILRRSPLIIVLAVLALALAALLAAEFLLGGPPAVPASVKRTAPADAKLLPPLAAVAPEQAYPETAARPLFTPTRRPAPEAVAVAQPTFQKGQFVLLGVIIVGNTRTAMLREKANGRLHRVEVGREVNGIRVSQVDRDTVTLAQGTETETLPLSVQRPGGAPGTPGQPAPQPPVPTASSMTGPFGATGATGVPTQAPGMPPAPAPNGFGGAAPPMPSFMQTPGPNGLPQQAPPNATGAPVPVQQGANGAAFPSQAADAALTPEEILARRRARRAQQTQ